MRIGNLIPRKVAIAAGLSLLFGQAAVAAPLQPGSHRMQTTAAGLFDLASELMRRGQPDQAAAILNLLAQDPSPDVRNEARFRLSLILETRGDHREAAVMLRRVVDERPQAVPARLKLATTLQAMGDEEAAWRELRALRTAELPPTVARIVDRLSASLQATKPFGFQLEFAMAPDGNINRATRSDSVGTVIGDFTIDESSKATSGIGAALRGLAHARLAIAENMQLQARTGFEASLYRDKQFNDISMDLSLGPQFRLGAARLELEAGIAQQWYGMEPYQRAGRLAAAVSIPVGAVSRARLDLAARRVDNRVNNLQDGGGYAFRLRYERALSPNLLVTASASADRFNARDEAYSTKSWQLGLAAYRDIGRLTLSAGIDIGRLEADERLVLLPEARREKLTRFSIGMVNRKLTVAGFAPMSRLVVERNRSTVEFYDYRRTRMELGITRAF